MADKALNNAGIKTNKQQLKALFFIESVQAENIAKISN